MRTIQIHPLSLAVGAVAVLAAFVLSAQTTPPAQTTWPPPKSMILNLYWEPVTTVTVAPGGSYTVLTVPTDRWLTITGASMRYGSGSLRWGERDSSGAITKKGSVEIGQFVDQCCGGGAGVPEGSPVASGGPIGWTFAPGSEVVITNPLTVIQQLGTISLIGYYSRN